MLKTFTLPAGTICKRNGIPFVLVEDTKISTHPGNIEMIREEFVPAVSGPTGSATALSPECAQWQTATGPLER